MATSKGSGRKPARPGHHRHGFTHFYNDIINCELDKGLVDCLISRLILTTEDAEKVRQTPSGQANCNKVLLDILKERPYNTFTIFNEALETSDPIHNYLANEMKVFEVHVIDEKPHVKHGDESIHVDDYSVRFQKSYKTLVDGIPSPITIADRLLEFGVLNDEDYEDITSLSTIFQKNRKLLSKIAFKGRAGFEHFLRAMKQSDDCVDQDLAIGVENTTISNDDRLLLQIGITLLRENKNIPANEREIIQNLQDHWLEEDHVFVETMGTTKVLNTIKDEDVITIVGSSGSGKTAVMRHVVLSLKSKERFQVIPIESPDKVIEYRDINIKQIFLFDDVLGKYAVNPILAEKWEQLDKQIRHFLDKKGQMKLMFTVRKQVVNDIKFGNCSSIITKNIVDLEDDEIALTKEEKKKILRKHLNIKDKEGIITENDIEKACASDYPFPLLCKIVASNDERLGNIEKFFREPSSVLKSELGTLSTDNKEVYCSLVLCMLSNGRIGKEFFNVQKATPEMFSIVTECCGLQTNISKTVVEESLKSAIGTYVSYDNCTFTFMHDAFQESISSHFAKKNPDVMFSYCNIDLIRDRVRINSRLLGDDKNVIVIDQDQFDVIANRMLTECEEGRFSSVLLSHVINDENFVEYFGTQLKHRKQLSIIKLMKKVSKERRNNKLKKMFLEIWRKNNQKKMVETDAAINAVINAPPRQSTFIYWTLAAGCYTLFDYFWRNASKTEQHKLLSRDSFFPLTKPFFPLAVLGGNVDIIRTLRSSGADINCFSNEGETPLSITSKTGRRDIAADLINWGAKVDLPDMYSHRIPSFICVENENVEVLKLLLNQNCDVNIMDIYGKSSTMLKALMTRKNNVVNALLEFDSKDHQLHAAALNCDIDSLKTFLHHGTINSKTRNGLTPLHYATQASSTIMIKLLLGEKANVSTSDESPTKQSAIDDNTQERKLFRTRVADINSTDKNGLTPLHLAVLNDHIEAVRLLLEKNADVNIKDHFGRLPLHYSHVSVISELLLNPDMSRSVVPRCPVVPENNACEVVDIIDGDQEDCRLTVSWWIVIWNVILYFLPFKGCTYRGYINQPDNQGNTPLHVIVETSSDIHPTTLERSAIADNIKLLRNQGANIHLRNDEGKLPRDLVDQKDQLQDLSTSHTSKKYIYRDEVVRKNLFLVCILLCYVIYLSPLTWTMANILDEYNFLPNSSISNQTNIDVRTEFQQRVNELKMYYMLLVGIVYLLFTCVEIIRVVIQLGRIHCRYCIICLILLPVMKCSAVTLFVAYDKTHNAGRAVFNCLVSFVSGFNLMFAINMKEFLSLKMKQLHTILTLFIFVYMVVNILLSIGTLSIFMDSTIKNKTTPTFYKPLVDSNQYGSLCNNVNLLDLNGTTRFRPNTSMNTSMNCTEKLDEPKRNFMSFYYTVVYIFFIFIGTCILQIIFRKNHVPLSKNRIEHTIIRRYFENLITMAAFCTFMGILFVMIEYLVFLPILNGLIEKHQSN